VDPATESPAVHHETSDVNVRGVLAFCGGLLAAGIVIHVAVWLLFLVFNAREARQPAPEFPLAIQQENRLPPEPRLQTNPRQDLRDLRAQEDAVLHSYGWVDRNAGVVRVPIERAMELTVQRGLPTRTQGNK
jgi:hypothetical protein